MSNPILNLSFDFALHIINYCEDLQSKKKFVLSNQLLKSGTSIGANMKMFEILKMFKIFEICPTDAVGGFSKSLYHFEHFEHYTISNISCHFENFENFEH